jgi:hypothetical protein
MMLPLVRRVRSWPEYITLALANQLDWIVRLARVSPALVLPMDGFVMFHASAWGVVKIVSVGNLPLVGANFIPVVFTPRGNGRLLAPAAPGWLC